MTTLAQAPLIETIFEIKWGDSQVNNNVQEFNFSQEDTSFFVGQFNQSATKAGFTFVENINANYPVGFPALMPHMVSHRYRKTSDTWPCYQIGLGIFTVNQVNEGYDWKSFKDSILSGLKILNEGHPKGLTGLVGSSIELKYIDGFIFTDNESGGNFLKNKLNVSFSSPSDFLKAQSINAESFEVATFNFVIKTNSPLGHMIVEFNRRQINGQEGYVMETIMRTTGDALPKFNIEDMSKWLDEAHDNQKHAFKTLINVNFAESFK